MQSRIALLLFFVLSPLLSAAPLLKIHDGKTWRELDSTEWKKLPRTEVKATSRDKAEKTYSGVTLPDILKLMQAPSGPTLRGPEMSRVVLITATDGYQVSFSLAELDSSFLKRTILVADQADNAPLGEFEGKLMLVCADEARHSRWIRQIQSIVLTRPVIPES